MKRGICIAVISVAFLSLATLSFAQKAAAPKTAKPNLEVVRGQIVSIDPAKNEIVLKETKTAAERTIAVDAKVIPSLKVGEKVKVKINTENNKTESVQEIKNHPRHQ